MALVFAIFLLRLPPGPCDAPDDAQRVTNISAKINATIIMDTQQVIINTTLHFRNRRGHIYAVVYHHRKQRYASMHLKVPPEQWDAHAERPLCSRSTNKLDLHNNRAAAWQIEKALAAFKELVIKSHDNPSAINALDASEILNAILPSKNNKTDIFIDMSRHLYNEKVKESTSRQRHSALNSLKKFFTEHNIAPHWENVTRQNMQMYFDSLQNSAKTIKVVRSHLRILLAEANMSKHCLIDEITIPKETRSIEERKRNKSPLSPRQLKALENATLSGKKASARDMFIFQCFTGLRVSEVISVARGEYEIIDNEIKVRQKKSRRGHVTYACPPLFASAGEYLNRIRSQNTLMQGDDATITRKIDYFLKKIARELPEFQSGIDVTKDRRGNTATQTVPQWETLSTHLARHTFVSDMYRQGIPKEVVIRATGHTDTKMIDMVYLHLDQEAERRRACDAYKGAGLIMK